MRKIITEDNFNRLSAALMEKFDANYDEAQNQLNDLRLHLVCGPAVVDSISLQAALITAINTGKRAFLGGVTVCFENCNENIPYLLPVPKTLTLQSAVQQIGGVTISVSPPASRTFILMFGLPASDNSDCLEVVCNSWQGGIAIFNDPVVLTTDNHLPLGGIAAAAIAVGIAFFKLSGIDKRCADTAIGVSLWKPEIKWSCAEGTGPRVEFLPQKLWVLGLGHLGQGYLWCLGLLPYETPEEVLIMLQDNDIITEANLSAGLLCDNSTIRQYKTRVADKWLKEIGFNTLICERKFDDHTVRQKNEPSVAVCGFDNALSRQYLENAGFDLVIESGLGGSLARFDDIVLHSFPDATKLAKDIWAATQASPEINNQVFKNMKVLEKDGCGMLPLTLAGKAISSSFVGALAGSFVIAELIRAANGLGRYEEIHVQLRSLKHLKAFAMAPYKHQMAQNGVTGLQIMQEKHGY